MLVDKGDSSKGGDEDSNVAGGCAGGRDYGMNGLAEGFMDTDIGAVSDG